jgi:hypothetical protein
MINGAHVIVYSEEVEADRAISTRSSTFLRWMLATGG